MNGSPLIERGTVSPVTTALWSSLYSAAAEEVEVAAEKVRARGGPDDSPRGAATAEGKGEGAEAVRELVRGRARQEDGLCQEVRT